mmetsp:Transcript_4341/g.5800  ORF Transcript_4341/g.5800 Transcript_4341/m.5800 type:complete len:166 (-) Transcript_4341:165-662(-)
MDDWAGFIDQFLGEVRSVVVEHNKGARTFTTAVQEFVHAVDWKESWLIALLFSHVSLLCIIVFTRRNSNVQAVLFFSMLLLIYLAEPLNNLLRTKWELFAAQPYFDKNGLFLSVVFSLPLLVFTLIILVNSLIGMTRLMVKVKRAQLIQKAKAEAKTDEGSKKKK